jgi:hypothetical protein
MSSGSRGPRRVEGRPCFVGLDCQRLPWLCRQRIDSLQHKPECITRE